MAAGSLSPLRAQSRGNNAEFNIVTCRELKVIDEEGETKVILCAGRRFRDQTISGVMVHGKNRFALMNVGEEGGKFEGDAV